MSLLVVGAEQAREDAPFRALDAPTVVRPRHRRARGPRRPVDRARSIRNAPTIEVTGALDLPVSCDCAWSFLADVESHSTWNPLVRWARGTLAEHADIEFVDTGGRRRIVRVTSMSAPVEVCLYWHHPTPGALAVEHVIELEALSPRTCRITQRQLYRGALVALLHAADSTGANALRRMNEALRAALERAPTHSMACGSRPRP